MKIKLGSAAIAASAVVLSIVALPASAHASQSLCSGGFMEHSAGAGYGVADGHLIITPGSNDFNGTGDENGDGTVCFKYVGRPASDSYPFITILVHDDKDT